MGSKEMVQGRLRQIPRFARDDSAEEPTKKKTGLKTGHYNGDLLGAWGLR